MKRIENQTFDEERALYHLTDAEVQHCTFAGPADGESALKESADILVSDCSFSLRYPFWHAKRFRAVRCTLDEKTRAPLWYASCGVIEDTEITGVKCLRECDRMTLNRVHAVSPEFGWRCRGVEAVGCDITSEYLFFESRDLLLKDFTLHGKYSFQYTENITVEDSLLDTKDAFWHAKNVTVKNCTVKGEYLGWFSEGLTLINCKIIGTQPFCYCERLTLIDCTMEETDLAFEYSDVHAEIKGSILSVKNPKTGKIVADAYGDIILGDAIMELDCEILTRK